VKPLLRIGLLLLLGLVLLARWLEHLDGRVSTSSRPQAVPITEPNERPRAAPAARLEAPAATARPEVELPPPTAAQLDALGSADEDAIRDVLRQLPSHAPTPELDAALAAAAGRTRWPGLQRRMACLRARGAGMPLDDLFSALPPDPGDVAWRQEDTGCLVRAIAQRATEDPGRALAVLAPAAVSAPAPAILDGLAATDPSEMPPAIADALAPAQPRLRRSAAVEAAVAMGAAAKWPERVAAWLDDADRGLRLATLRALAARGDASSQALAARFIAENPGEDEARRLVEAPLRRPSALVPALVNVVHDEAAPPFARAVAARLVGEVGDEAACRLIAAVRAPDATLAPALADAAARTTLRFGPPPGGGR
jgi:hypothetical protein